MLDLPKERRCPRAGQHTFYTLWAGIPTFVIGIVVFLFLAGSASAQSEGATKAYPPYPDTWDWVPKHPRREGFASVHLYNLPNGDVLVDYVNSEKLPWQKEFESFFGRKTYKSKEEAPIGLNRPPDRKYIPDSRYTANLNSGKRVSGLGLRANPCYRDTESVLRVDDDRTKTFTEKVVLYLLDQPKRYRTNKAVEHCNDGPDFDYWVVVVMPNVLPLEDGTFLAADGDAGIVLRFTETLETRSPLLGKLVFVVDTEEFYRKMALYQGDRANERLDWDRFHRALRRWVLELQKTGR